VVEDLRIKSEEVRAGEVDINSMVVTTKRFINLLIFLFLMNEKIQPYRLRAHHLPVIAHFLQYGSYPDYEETYIESARRWGHSEESARRVLEYLKELSSNPKSEIMLVGEMDDICNKCGEEIGVNCRKPVADINDDRDDAIVMRNYGLDFGKVYRLNELIERMQIKEIIS